MHRSRFALTFLCLILLVTWGAVAQASGVITFQVEVLPGLSISSPDNLSFGPLAPGQTTYKELGITVWANVPWELWVQAIDYDLEGGLQGIVEVEASRGNWLDLFTETRIFRSDETGPDGMEVQVPFRITGSYADVPGSYSFQAEFTVVPSL